MLTLAGQCQVYVVSIYIYYTNRASGVNISIYMSAIIFEMAVRILLKIGRCDIQGSENNLCFVQTQLFKCSY